MNLRSRLGGLLYHRPLATEDEAPDSEAMAREKARQAEEAHRLHMKRMRVVRDQELDELRQVMAQRGRRSRIEPEPSARSAAANAPTRPMGTAHATRMVSIINDLEVKVLSEPMALPPEQPGAPERQTPPRDRARPAPNAPSHPLDDAALMVAARRWDQAAELLLELTAVGSITAGLDWIARSAIDLLDRDGQTDRAGALRQRYALQRRQAPKRIVPPGLQGPATGRLRIIDALPWHCPAHLGHDAVHALQDLMQSGKAGNPVAIDWSAITRIEADSVQALQRCVESAIGSRVLFTHVGLPRLIRTARQAAQSRNDAPSWQLWLALLNWLGFRNAHGLAATVFAKRFQRPAPGWLSMRCICQAMNAPETGPLKGRVCAVRLAGDLTREHLRELEHLDARPPRRGHLMLLDCRLLVSMDFFFGAELLNGIIRRHAQGEAIGIAYAHPLLGHFFCMLGLQGYAKLHALPSAPPSPPHHH